MTDADAALAIAAHRHTEHVVGLLGDAALKGMGVHVITGVPHICPLIPMGVVLIEHRPQGLN